MPHEQLSSMDVIPASSWSRCNITGPRTASSSPSSSHIASPTLYLDARMGASACAVWGNRLYAYEGTQQPNYLRLDDGMQGFEKGGSGYFSACCVTKLIPPRHGC